MTITTTEHKRCYLVKTEGRIDSSNGDELLDVFKSLNQDGHYNIVFDMADVNFMSSKGWWVLIETQKACRQHNRGEIVLAKVQEKIESSLDLVGLNNYFTIFDDVVSAVGSF